MTNTPAPGLVARPLAELSYALCASPSYIARRGAPETARELRSHNCLFYSGDIAQNPWRIATPEGEEISIEVAGPLTCNNVEVLRTAAVSGLGVIALSRYLLETELQQGTLVELLLDHKMPVRQIHLVTLPDRLLAAKTRAFIDFLLPASASGGNHRAA